MHMQNANETSAADRLIERILADAQAQAQAVLAAADEEAAKLLAAAQAEAQKINAANARRQAARQQAALETARTNAALQQRRDMLKAKRAVLDQAFELAAERIEQMGNDDRAAIIKAMLLQEAEGGESIIPAARDAEIIAAALDGVNSALADNGRAALTLGTANDKLGGGFILKAAGYEKNCSFSAMLKDIRAQEESAVAAILFG